MRSRTAGARLLGVGVALFMACPTAAQKETPSPTRATASTRSAITAPDSLPPLSTVAEILVPRDSLNLPVRIGERVRVRGVFTTAPRVVGRETHIANFQDATAGIAIFSPDTVTLTAFAPGDSVEVVGTLGQNDGMEEIRIDRIARLGRARMPAPIDVDAADLHGEEYSGLLVRVSGRVSMERGDAGTLRIVDASGAVPVYVRRAYLDSESFARELFAAREATVVGIAAQNDPEPPFDDAYDLLPRTPEDYTFRLPPPYLFWTLGVVIAGLLGLALYAWMRRLRAEERADVLTRLAADLERREAILSAVAFAGARFLEEGDIAVQLRAVLARLADATSADGCIVLTAASGAESPALDREAAASRSAAAGPDPGGEALRRIWDEAPEAGRWRDRLRVGEAVEASAHEVHDGAGPRSALLVPVFVDATLWGALAFYSEGEQIAWSDAEIDALRAAAAIVGGAVSRRAALEALRDREEQLRQAQKMEAIGRLAGGIAHDFNNLLTAVGGNAALLAADTDLKAEYQSLASEIVDSVERGSALARNLLAFSRRQALPSEVQDATGIVRGMLPMLRRLLGERITLETELDTRVWVSLPPGHLEQVVMNLAVNARDAMAEGGRLSIDIDRIEGAVGPEAVIEVVDTGSGMGPEIVQSIFDPFFTTKSGGSGLGLSIVYGIVMQAEGAVDVESEPGEGTRIRIRLPAREASERPPREMTITTAASSGDGTILLVEDEGAVRSLARRVLVRAGYEVLEAENGEQALRVLDAHAGSIDLLLTDVRMPRMSGPELVERLASSGLECPVLFMSGYAAEELQLGEVDAGRYLSKPFTPRQLVQRVAAVISGGTAQGVV